MLPDSGLPNIYDHYEDELNPMEGSELEPLDDDDEGFQFQHPLLSDTQFEANLAEDLSETELNDLASDILEDIKSDLQARSDWDNAINLAFKYLGYKIEEGRQEPFINACSAYDTTLSQSLIHAYSVFRAELFPSEGPCAAKVLGVDTQEKMDSAERVELFINNYLTAVDEGYYPDSEQLILFTIFCGSAFRKVIPSSKTGFPEPRMVKPQDFIVNPDTVDLMSSSRMTQRIPYTRSDIEFFERTGFYLPDTLPPEKSSDDDDGDSSELTRTISRMDGMDKDSSENRLVYDYYEAHINLNPDKVEKGVYRPAQDVIETRPYIVTICKQTKKIAAIRRGWEENTPDFKRAVYFINYYYIRGFGIYGLGLAHLMGSNAVVLTSTLRQLIDAGTLKNFPAFIADKGMRLEQNDIMLGPGECRQVETTNRPIRDLIMPLPYGEPSAALMNLRNELVEQNRSIGAASQADIPDNRQNVSATATLAVLEVTNRVMSTVLRSFHTCLGRELKLIYKIFGKHLPDQPYPFMVPGKDTAVMKADFNDSVNIQPISDPNMLMRIHRVAQAEMQMTVAEKNPQLHNMREVLFRYYTATNVPNIDAILPPPEQPKPLDAVSENMAMMGGKDAIAGLDQNHDAHIFLHNSFATQAMQMQNLPAYMKAMMHNQVHKAMKVVKEHQELQQIVMPMMEQIQKSPMVLLTIPQVQYIVDQMDAEEEHQKQLQGQQQAANMQQPMDPTVAMLEEVKQKREASHLHMEETKINAEKEIAINQLKSQTELEISKMRAHTEHEKLQVQLIIAQQKQEYDVAKEQIKADESRLQTQIANEVKQDEARIQGERFDEGPSGKSFG